MAINVKNLVPAFAIHPGEMLRDELAARDIKQNDFAKLIGYKPTQLNEILKGKRDVNADFALLIGKALGINPEYWMGLQAQHDLDKVKIEEKTKLRLESISIWNMCKEYVAVSYLKKKNIISGDPLEDISKIKSLYGVNNVEQFPSIYTNSGYFRKSTKLETNSLNLFAWTKIVAQRAQDIEVKKFNHEKKDELIDKLKEVLKENKKTLFKVESVLNDYGIKLIIEERPDKCAIDAYSFWSNDKPAIGMTLRHKRIDNFAFNLLHELGHVHLHLVNNPKIDFIDIDKDSADYKNSKEEKEANNFAAENLVDKNAWNEFKKANPIFTDIKIKQFASTQNVHPGVILGKIGDDLKIYLKTSISKELN